MSKYLSEFKLKVIHIKNLFGDVIVGKGKRIYYEEGFFGLLKSELLYLQH